VAEKGKKMGQEDGSRIKIRITIKITIKRRSGGEGYRSPLEVVTS
jgi:hypothetical protein